MATSVMSACCESNPSVLVAGLVWVMVTPSSEAPVYEDVLVGPAVGAGLGVYAMGGRPEMLVSVPDHVPATAFRWIFALDSGGRLLSRRQLAPLRWSAGPILGDTCRWKLEGDPRDWVATCEASSLRGRTLALANGNPRVYADVLSQEHHHFASIDIDASWGPSQLPAINQCLRRAQLVTITRTDYKRLSPDAFAGTGVGQRGGAALVVKSGSAGVTIKVEGKSRSLPAPAVPQPIRTDIGAGDLLLGLLTTQLGGGRACCSADDVEAAYLRACPVVARLLQTEHFCSFAEKLLGTSDAN